MNKCKKYTFSEFFHNTFKLVVYRMNKLWSDGIRILSNKDQIQPYPRSGRLLIIFNRLGWYKKCLVNVKFFRFVTKFKKPTTTFLKASYKKKQYKLYILPFMFQIRFRYRMTQTLHSFKFHHFLQNYRSFRNTKNLFKILNNLTLSTGR